MSLRHPPYEDCVAGEISRRHGYDSGAIRPALQELSRSASIRQTNEPRGLDWLQFKTGETRFRWSYLNPRPKILIPYTGTSRAYLRIEVAHEDPEILKGLGVELNGAPAKVRIEDVCCRGAVSEATAAMTVALSETDYSIAVIIVPSAGRPDGGGSAVGVAQLTLDALPPGATAPGWTEEGERRIAVALAREKALLQQFKELPSGEIAMLEERIEQPESVFLLAADRASAGAAQGCDEGGEGNAAVPTKSAQGNREGRAKIPAARIDRRHSRNSDSSKCRISPSFFPPATGVCTSCPPCVRCWLRRSRISSCSSWATAAPTTPNRCSSPCSTSA